MRQVFNTSSLYLFTNNNAVLFVKFVAVFVPHLPTAPGTCQKSSKKAILSRLVSHADLSRISLASQLPDF